MKPRMSKSKRRNEKAPLTFQFIKKAQGTAPSIFENANRLTAVVPNGFHGTSFFGFVAKGFFFRRFGLLFYKGISAVVIAGEIGGRRFAAKITVDALIVH